VSQTPSSPGTDGAVSGGSTVLSQDPALIAVEITPEEIDACDEPERPERIEAARASPSESPETSSLVLPQDLLKVSGSRQKAVAQKAWDTLSPEDRLFNLCMLEPRRS
jgi:hypothetical protein